MNEYQAIYINDVELPVPSQSPNEHFSDVQGEMITSWIDGSTKPNPMRQNVYSIELVYDPIPYAVFKALLNLITPDESGYLNVKVYDDLLQDYRELKMLCSERNYVKKRYRDGWYASLSFTLTQI